jgi:hypothetical protein
MKSSERNMDCPCGTGDKYKNCCGKNVKENSIFDLINKGIIKLEKSTFLKRLYSSSTEYDKSFEILCKKDLIKIGRYHSLAMKNIGIAFKNEKYFDETIKTTIPIVMNMTHSIIAASELINRGFRLEAGLIFRNIYEKISLVIYLFYNPKDITLIKNDKIGSSQTISFSKKIINNIGIDYGNLSKHFVHVGKLQRLPILLQPYKKDDPDLYINITFLKLSTWLYYVISELVCYDYISIKKYWFIDKGEIKFFPFENELFTAFNFVGHKFLSGKIDVRIG